MQNNSVFPILHCFFLFHIQMFSLLLVHSMKGLLTCNSCSTQSSSDLTVVYKTLNESQFLFFFYHFPRSDQLIFIMWQLRIRSIGNNISVCANNLIPSKAKLHFDWKKCHIWKWQRSRINAIRISLLPKVSREYATLLPRPPLSSIIQSAKPLCCKLACGTKQDTVDENKNRETKRRGKKGAKHNQMADMPTHEKWQFGACTNY